eukprot:gene5202-6641_t
MRAVPSATSPRYLALWFPFLPAERLHRASRPRTSSPSAALDKALPLVFVERVKGALRLSAVSAQARAVGLVPGLTLADARARIPELAVADHDPLADAAFLERIADDCDRWTPLVALSGSSCTAMSRCSRARS